MRIRKLLTYDVVIPVYRPDDKLNKILDRLHRQRRLPEHILLINTGKEYYEEFFGEETPEKKYDDVNVIHISREEFDHGATRDMGIRLSEAECVLCMTDDALPADSRLSEELLRPIEEGRAESSYARQLPGRSSSVYEAASRCFNYPGEGCIKGSEDIETMGIKAFFCSDVCAMHLKKVYEELGGFEDHVIFNEDMVYARKLIDSGRHIAYVPSARVIHSHDYSVKQYFKRSFDQGVSHAVFKDTFSDVSSEKEGMRLLKRMIRFYIKKKKAHEIPKMFFINLSKYAGFRLGRSYEKLPEWLVLKLCGNREYFHNLSN